MALAYPDLTAGLLREGLRIRSWPEPVMLRAEDFRSDSQAGVFSLLQKHAGKSVDAILTDQQAQPYLDLISALISEGAREVITTDRNRRGERIKPSTADAAQAWLGLKILSCERAKRETEDFDEKERIRDRVHMLKQALQTVSVEP
jgi:hypothetical protein